MIERFEAVVMICLDQGVVGDETLQKRMLLARPADWYSFLKQSYLLAPIASRPHLVGLKAQIRDIDSEFQKSNSASKVNKAGQANRAKGEASWSQGSSSGTARSFDRGSARFAAYAPVAADAAAEDADVAKAHQGAEKLPAIAAGRKATSSRIVRRRMKRAASAGRSATYNQCARMPASAPVRAARAASRRRRSQKHLSSRRTRASCARC